MSMMALYFSCLGRTFTSESDEDSTVISLIISLESMGTIWTIVKNFEMLVWMRDFAVQYLSFNVKP